MVHASLWIPYIESGLLWDKNSFFIAIMIIIANVHHSKWHQFMRVLKDMDFKGDPCRWGYRGELIEDDKEDILVLCKTVNVMKFFLCGLFFFGLSLSFFSCNKDEQLHVEIKLENYKIQEVAITKVTNNLLNDSIGVYNINTPWGDFPNIYLPKRILKELKEYSTMQEPAISTATGCNKHELTGSNYKMAVNGYSHVANGYYIVRDCDAYRDNVFIPSAPFYVLPMDSPNCGYDPNALINRGFRVIKKDNGLFQFHTRVTMILSNLLGQQVNKTIPIELNKLEWNYAYFGMIG